MSDVFTPEVQDALVSMFSSEGWVYFIEDVQKNLNGINTLDGIRGEQQLGIMQGQLQVLRGILTYEDTIRTAINEREKPSSQGEDVDLPEITLDS